MGVEQLLKDLERSHEGLQHLHVEATEGNLNIILDSLTTMKAAYSFIATLTKVRTEECSEIKPVEVGEGDA